MQSVATKRIEMSSSEGVSCHTGAVAFYVYSNPLRGPNRRVVSGYRYYSPELGRWLSPDPLGENAFLQQYSAGKSLSERKKLYKQSLKPLYLFVQNDPLSLYDIKGLNDAAPSNGDDGNDPGDSDGYSCDPSGLGPKLCKCVPFWLRGQVVAAVCGTCLDQCHKWCISTMTDEDMPYGWVDLCVLDCDGRGIVCGASDCDFKF